MIDLAEEKIIRKGLYRKLQEDPDFIRGPFNWLSRGNAPELAVILSYWLKRSANPATRKLGWEVEDRLREYGDSYLDAYQRFVTQQPQAELGQAEASIGVGESTGVPHPWYAGATCSPHTSVAGSGVSQLQSTDHHSAPIASHASHNLSNITGGFVSTLKTDPSALSPSYDTTENEGDQSRRTKWLNRLRSRFSWMTRKSGLSDSVSARRDSRHNLID